VRNLFVVLSPFQLICAQEARAKFCSNQKNELVILHREPIGSPSYTQIVAVLDENWGRVRHVWEPKKKGPALAWARLKITAALRVSYVYKANAVFLGEPRIGWFQKLGTWFGKNTVWLDDGAATLLLLRKLEPNLSPNPDSDLPRLFSAFVTDEMQKQSGHVLLHNEFKQLQSEIVPKPADEKQLLIIGQWISEAGDLSQSQELALIDQVMRSHVNWSICYVPHRHDSSEKVEKIANLGPKVTPLGMPIELAIRLSGSVPTKVISFYSTALFTLKSMFNSIDAVAIRPDFPNLSDSRASDIDLVYREMPRYGIKVLAPAELKKNEVEP